MRTVKAVVDALDCQPHDCAAQLSALNAAIIESRRVFIDQVVPAVLDQLNRRLGNISLPQFAGSYLKNAEQFFSFLITAADTHALTLPFQQMASPLHRLVELAGDTVLQRIAYWKFDTSVNLSAQFRQHDEARMGRTATALDELGLLPVLDKTPGVPGVDGKDIVAQVARAYGIKAAALKGGEPLDGTTHVIRGSFAGDSTTPVVRIHRLPSDTLSWDDHPIEATRVLLHEARHGVQSALLACHEFAGDPDAILLRLSLLSQQQLALHLQEVEMPVRTYNFYYGESLCERDARKFSERILTLLVGTERSQGAALAFRNALHEATLPAIAIEPEGIDSATRPDEALIDSDYFDVEGDAPDAAPSRTRELVVSPDSLISLARELASHPSDDSLAPLLRRINKILEAPMPGELGLLQLSRALESIRTEKRRAVGLSTGTHRLLGEVYRRCTTLLTSHAQKQQEEAIQAAQESRRTIGAICRGEFDQELRQAIEYQEPIDQMAAGLLLALANPRSSVVQIGRRCRQLLLKSEEGLLGLWPTTRFIGIGSRITDSLDQFLKERNADETEQLRGFIGQAVRNASGSTRN